MGAGKPVLVWRSGFDRLLRGEPARAVEIFTTIRSGCASAIEETLLASGSAIAHGYLGDADACADQAERGLAGARALRQPQAHALAHLAASVSARFGADRGAVVGHLTQAVSHAGSLPDLRLLSWVRWHLAVDLVGTGRFTEAVTEAGRAHEPATRAADPHLLVLNHSIIGVALARLGQLAESERELERAVSLGRRHTSAQLASALAGLAELYLLRGRTDRARDAYAEALRIGELSENLPAVAAALIGLARSRSTTDPIGAARLLDQAPPRMFTADRAALDRTRGWIVLAAAGPSDVTSLASAAMEQARRWQDPAGLAEACQLRALAGGDPAQARRDLNEAVAILTEIDAGLEADRVRVRFSRLTGLDVAEQIEARLAAARLTEAGVIGPDEVTAARGTTVQIRTLGRLDVLLAGRAVARSAWQSRKARQLLGILAAHHDRPVSREQLGELLWPGGQRSRVGHRLSALLCTLRGVLDPQRRYPAEHYLLAGRDSVSLNLSNVQLDVALFLTEARYGLHLYTRSAPGAREVLSLAHRRYTGDFVADDPYHDWATSLREDTRRVYLRVSRALAELARQRGDLEQSAEHLRQVLVAEPYDEGAYERLISTLVESQRPGEAVVAYQRYVAAMRVLGVPARPAAALGWPADRAPALGPGGSVRPVTES